MGAMGFAGAADTYRDIFLPPEVQASAGKRAVFMAGSAYPYRRRAKNLQTGIFDPAVTGNNHSYPAGDRGRSSRFPHGINIHHVTLVLDDSASMSALKDAKNPDSNPRFRAIEALKEHLNENEPFSVNLIVSGPQPKLLASTLTNMKDVEDVLSLWQPKRPLHNFLPSFRLARQLAGKKGQIIFMTDSAPPEDHKGKIEPPAGIEWLAFGDPTSNIGIISASRKQNIADSREEIFLLVRNFSATGKDIFLTCYEGLDKNKPVIRKKLKIDTNAQLKIPLEFKKLFKGPLTLEITPGDALTEDNKVVLMPEKSVPVRILSKIKNPALEQLVGKTFEALGKEIILTDQRPNLIISDQKDFIKKQLKMFPDCWALEFLNPAPEKEKIKRYYGPYVVEKNNPVCDGICLRGSRWAVDTESKFGSSVVPLISCRGQILLGEALNTMNQHQRLFYLSFVPSKSNLQNTASWPILFHNFIRCRLAALPGFVRYNYRTEENATGNYYDSKKLVISSVSGTKNKPEERFEFPGGVFNFSYPIPAAFKILSDDKPAGMIAFNFMSAEESDLRNSSSGSWKSKTDTSKTYKATWRDHAWIFLLAALALFLVHTFLVSKGERNS